MISQEATVPELNSASSVATSPNVTPAKRPRAGRVEEDLDLIPVGSSDEDDNKLGYLVFDDNEIANSLMSPQPKQAMVDPLMRKSSTATHNNLSTMSELESEKSVMFQLWMRKVKQ